MEVSVTVAGTSTLQQREAATIMLTFMRGWRNVSIHGRDPASGGYAISLGCGRGRLLVVFRR